MLLKVMKISNLKLNFMLQGRHPSKCFICMNITPCSKRNCCTVIFFLYIDFLQRIVSRCKYLKEEISTSKYKMHISVHYSCSIAC